MTPSLRFQVELPANSKMEYKYVILEEQVCHESFMNARIRQFSLVFSAYVLYRALGHASHDHTMT